MTLGNYIKGFRIENNMTQKQLAEELGIPGSNADVCRIERGSERTLGMVRARFLVYITIGEFWNTRKENAKSVFVNVDDLRPHEREYLVKVVMV